MTTLHLSAYDHIIDVSVPYYGNQSIVAQFYTQLAHSLETNLDNGPEKSVAMRKLLESKDAAMRAAKP